MSWAIEAGVVHTSHVGARGAGSSRKAWSTVCSALSLRGGGSELNFSVYEKVSEIFGPPDIN